MKITAVFFKLNSRLIDIIDEVIMSGKVLKFLKKAECWNILDQTIEHCFRLID